MDTSWLALDSLFGEWGYVIDLDREVFEAYEGFQRAPHDRGRFARRAVPEDADGYWPMALVAEWPLTDLPTDDEFCHVLQPAR